MRSGFMQVRLERVEEGNEYTRSLGACKEERAALVLEGLMVFNGTLLYRCILYFTAAA